MGKKKKDKEYTINIKLRVSDRPDTDQIEVNGYRGTILKMKKEKAGTWIVTVKFITTSLIGIMVATDERIISTELH